MRLHRFSIVVAAASSLLLFACKKSNQIDVGTTCAEDSECPDDGNPCHRPQCKDQVCLSVALDDGSDPKEGEGKCYGGVFCGGCFDGSACHDVPNVANCGTKGETCADCALTQEMAAGTGCLSPTSCTAGACKYDAIAALDKKSCPGGGGQCRAGVCCGGCWDKDSGSCKQGQSDNAFCGLGGGDCGPCADDNPCTTNACTIKGICETPNAPDQAACPGGACYSGACCANGCWDGDTCEPGDKTAVCGQTGGSCADCTDLNPCMKSDCVSGACSAAVPLDGDLCPDGLCVQGQCKCGGPTQPCCKTGDACEPGQACSNGTCGECGASGKPCCTGDVCNGNSVCANSACVDCGGVNQPCCTNGTACTGATVCEAGSCVACGGSTQPCCTGSVCDSGSNCAAGTCQACGASSQACCANGTPCLDSTTVCQSSSCTHCGAKNEPCCAGSTCETWSACGSSTCNACGKAGEACCPGATACDASLACSSSTCQGCTSQISVGNGHECLIKADKSLWCWGDNASGQLGTNGTTGVSVPTQVTLPGGGTVEQVFAGSSRTVVRKTDGTVWNLGSTTVQVNLGGNLALEVAAGTDSSCARVDNAGSTEVWCWTTPSSLPAQVVLPGSRQATGLAAGDHHVCAVAGDGTAWCWGTNSAGQLGNGGTVTSSTPVPAVVPGAIPPLCGRKIP